MNCCVRTELNNTYIAIENTDNFQRCTMNIPVIIVIAELHFNHLEHCKERN